MVINRDPLLSICISSYNKGEKCVDMVSRLLEINDDRFNIVICDDRSEEFSVRALQRINSNKVIIKYNQKNLGACSNWHETINQGNGTYLLHVLDRDYIERGIIKPLIDFLEVNEIGVGYIGNYPVNKSNRLFDILPPGEETVSKIGGIPIHPTGFLIKKSEWNSKDFKDYFYNTSKYGIYPHSYIISFVGLKKEILFVRSPFCRCVYSLGTRSSFYDKKLKHNFWWEPKAVFDTSIKMIIYICILFDVSYYKNEFIANVFQYSIARGTVGYREALLDKRLMAHYSQKVKNISISRVLIYNILFMLRFIVHLKDFNTEIFQMLFRILKIAKKNHDYILKCY